MPPITVLNPNSTVAKDIVSQTQDLLAKGNILGTQATQITGKPFTPTTLTSNKEDQIANNQSTLAKAGDIGIRTDANGNQVYANGTLVNPPPPQPTGTDAQGNVGNWRVNSNTGFQEFVPQGAKASWETGSIVSDVAGLTKDTGGTYSVPYVDPFSTKEYTDLQQQFKDQLARSDANTASSIQLIQQQYDNLINQQKQINEASAASRQQSLLMGGGARYAQLSSAGVMNQTVSYGLSEIADLTFKEQQAINDARVAGQKGDMDIQDKMLKLYNDTAEKKQNALQKVADTLNTANKEARDYNFNVQKEAVAQKQRDIENARNKATDYYNQVTKPKNDLVREAAKLGASQKIIDAMNNSKTLEEAITAGGTYLQSGKYSFQKTTDAFGNEVLWAINQSNPKERFVMSGGGTGGFTPSPNPIGSVSSAITNPDVNSHTGLSFAQYGLIANTDFKPDNQIDQMAQRYLDYYLKNQTIPGVYQIGGRGMKPEAMAQVDTRARDLYYKATGEPLPNPQVLKGYWDAIRSNIKMANNLKIQEKTVTANVNFSLENIKNNDLNSVGFKPLDAFINTVSNLFDDPNVGQLIAQNATIQNELGSLLALKNASGTTVYDKLTSAGIITTSDNEAQIKQKVNAILKEAVNFANGINSANADVYKQIDPLLQDPNNPLRQSSMRTSQQKMTDYYTNNPDNRPKIDKAISDFKAKYGKDISYDDLLQAFPEANNSISMTK